MATKKTSKRIADVELHRPEKIENLKPKPEPYWAQPLALHCSLGLRVTDRQQVWTARYKKPDKSREYKKLGRRTDLFEFEQAREAAIKWFNEMQAGITVARTVPTVQQVCAAYVAHQRKAAGEATAHDAEMRFRRTVDDTPLGATSLADLKSSTLTDWLHKQVADGSSKATANRNLTALKAALNLAHAQDDEDNPTITADMAVRWGRKVKPFKKADGRREIYLDLKQRKALLKHAKGAVGSLINAALLTGGRAGELTSATRSQFDARLKTLRLNGKTGPREVQLSKDAVELFETLAKSKGPHEHLLTRDDGKPWAHSDWDELVRDAATKAKLPAGVCLYTCRHSHITQAIKSGLTTLEVALQVGTSLMMIQKHYGQKTDISAKLNKVKMT